MNSSIKAHLALLCTNLFFAANFSLVKYISPSIIKPFAVNLMRVGLCLALFWSLWILAFSTKKENIGKVIFYKKDLPRFLLCALTGIAINQMFFIKGITYTSPIHASLLMLLTPLLITVFASWLLKERITFLKGLGLVLGVTGAMILILSKDQSTNVSNYILGDMLILINAVSYSVYFVLVKPLMKQYSPVMVMRWVFTFGFVMILPFCWTEFTHVQWSLFEISHTLSLTAIIFTGTFLAYLFNIYGMQHIGAGAAGSYIYTQPIFAAIISIVFMNELLTLEKLLACLLIFTGVYFVSFGKRSLNKSLGVIEE